MRSFSIKELDRLSGIKAHTIRAWEMRYDVLSPQRTATNIRYYSVADLKHLLNIVVLIKRKGYRISQLAGISNKTIEQTLLTFRQDKDQDAIAIDHLLIYMFEEDTARFEWSLDQCIHQRGIHKTIHEIIFPFLERADILSYSKSSTDIHFAVAIIRRKIIYGIESLSMPKQSAESALLFLLKDEHYDLILLYINYSLKAAGINVFYLGTNISIPNLEKVIADKKPDLMFSYITNWLSNTKACIAAIENRAPQTRLFVVHPFKHRNARTDSSNTFFWNLRQLDEINSL